MPGQSDLMKQASWGCVGFILVILIWLFGLRVLDLWFLATFVGTEATFPPLRSLAILFGWLAGGAYVTRGMSGQTILWLVVIGALSIGFSVYAATRIGTPENAVMEPGMIGLAVFGYSLLTYIISAVLGYAAGAKLIHPPSDTRQRSPEQIAQDETGEDR